MEPTQPYELKDLNELKGNPKNPRRISKEDFAALKASMKRFGDLSCVVFNIRSQQFVAGHQRVESIKTNPQPRQIIILERYNLPNDVGTVAVGKIFVDNEEYKYREVDWDAGTEMAANIAANRIQGEFNIDLLGEMDYEISQLENGAELLEASGQSEKELKKIFQGLGVETADEDTTKPEEENKTNTLDFSVTSEQREVIQEAINYYATHRDMATEKNTSINGNALYYMAREFLDRLHAEMEGAASAAEPAA